MELRVLKYFLAVAEEGNITWAAELLRISQPTLSRQLKQLEEELGVTLFTRGPHNITLTREGQLLRDRARSIVELAEKTERDIAGIPHTELEGCVSVCCGETRSVDYLTSRMADFRREHPRVRFTMLSATANVIRSRIDQGLCDVALMTEPINVERYGFLRLGMADVWGAMVRDDDELASLDVVRPDDLVGRDLLLPYRAEVLGELFNWFGHLRDESRLACTYNLPLNAAVAVRQGVGVALCYNVGQCGEDLRHIPLHPHLEASSVVAWRRSGVVTPAASAFIDYLKAGLDAVPARDAVPE